MFKDDIYQTHITALQNLQGLSLIRGLALVGQALALAYFSLIKPIDLPVVAISLVLSIYGAITAATWVRSKKPVPIVDNEFFIHLLVDIMFFSALLYLSGGASNPFISYYLIPISIAAITLPRRLTVATALAALLCYSWLLNNHITVQALAPVADAHGSHSSAGNLHILGMWANFVISAVIITYVISRMAQTLRLQQQRIAEQREHQLRDEQLLAIGTLAAGTAHELGTPLNTMKIISDELVASQSQPNAELSLLQSQIELCKTTLRRLLTTAEQSQSSQLQPQLLTHYFSSLIERWQLMRPSLKASIQMAEHYQSASFHPTIEQSILNLLNNAADVSPEKVEVDIDWDDKQAQISIRDYGAGLQAEDIDHLGQAFVTNKRDGLGLGLFLSQATLTRFGGKVSLQNAPSGGTLTQIVLPLNNPAPAQDQAQL